MARKKTRTIDGCAESTDLPEKYDSKGNCPHIVKGVDIGGLKKAWKKKEDVICHLCKKKQFSTTKKTAGAENDIWICMNCGHVGCGNARHDHGMDHFNTPHSDCHSVVAVVDTWTLRCLQCRLNINLDVNTRASDAIAFLKKNLIGFKTMDVASEDNPTSTNMEKKSINTLTIVPENKLKSKNSKDQKVFPVLGLENLGNTCYMNAVLQCLTQTPLFVKSLESCCQSKVTFHLSGGENLIHQGSDEHLPPLEGILGEGGQLTKAVSRVLQRVQSGSRLRKTGITTENPGDVIRLMKKLSNTFFIGEQHDSHELLRFLLEGLRTEDLKRYQRGILNAMNICSSTKEVLPKERDMLIAYKNQALQKKLVIEQIFGGSLVSILKCLECNSVTTTFECFMDISLPMESEKAKGAEGTAVPSEVRHSKYQQKKERKMARRAKRKSRGNRGIAEMLSAQTLPKRNHSSNESGTDSEADVEDNVESENILCNAQGDGPKTEATFKAESTLICKHKDCNVTCGPTNDKDVSCESEKLYPYTALLFISNQDEQPGPMVEPAIPNEHSVCNSGVSPELSIVESCCSPELSTDIYNCKVHRPAVVYESGSPDQSLNEDFGSCEGGRGSPASSIEQDDWEEEDADGVEKKENIPGAPEYNILVQGVEKSLHMNEEQDSIDIPPPEPFEFTSSDSFKEENLPLNLTYNPDPLYDNVSGRYIPFENTSSYANATNLDTHGIKRCNEGVSPEGNHVSDIPDNDKQEIADESLDRLVDGLIGFPNSENEETEEVADNSDPDNNFSGHVDLPDGSETVWGATLSPHAGIECVAYSLEHCLKNFFSEEILSGPNRIGCERCTRRREGREPEGDEKLVQTNALKQLLFMKLPEVLTIHLKRFEVVGTRMSKITRKVSFPLELDVSPYTSAKMEAKQPDAPPCYQLYGVIEHYGHLSSGHYVAYIKVQEEMSGHGNQSDDTVFSHERANDICKENVQVEVAQVEGTSSINNGSTAKWYYVSDSFVKESSLKEVMDAEAYILFYKRV